MENNNETQVNNIEDDTINELLNLIKQTSLEAIEMVNNLIDNL
jgi:hypothetical protein